MKYFLAALVLSFLTAHSAQARQTPDSECLKNPDCIVAAVIERAPELAPIKRLFDLSPEFRDEFAQVVRKAYEQENAGRPGRAVQEGQTLFQRRIAQHAWKGDEKYIVSYFNESLALSRYLEKTNVKHCADLWNGTLDNRNLKPEALAYIGRMLGNLADAYATGLRVDMQPINQKQFSLIAAQMFERDDVTFSDEELSSIDDSGAKSPAAYCTAMQKFMGAYLNPLTPQTISALRYFLVYDE